MLKSNFFLLSDFKMITNSSTGELMTNLSHPTLHHQVVIPENYQVTLDESSTRYILLQEHTAAPTNTNENTVKHELTDNDNIDEFLSATNLEDFLWYNCPKCPFKCKTSPNFIEHVVQNHPKAKHVIEDLTMKKHEDTKDLDEHMLDEVENYIQYDMNRAEDGSEDSEESDNDSSEEYQSSRCGSHS